MVIMVNSMNSVDFADDDEDKETICWMRKHFAKEA